MSLVERRAVPSLHGLSSSVARILASLTTQSSKKGARARKRARMHQHPQPHRGGDEQRYAGAEDVLREQVEFSLAQSLPANALFLAEQLRALAPDSPETLRLLALCHQRAGCPAKALSLLRSAREQARGALPNGCAYLGALCCCEVGLWLEGIGFLLGTATAASTEITEATPVPGGAPGLYLLGVLCRNSERRAEAEICFRRCLCTNPFMWCALDALCSMGRMTEELRASVYPVAPTAEPEQLASATATPSGAPVAIAVRAPPPAPLRTSRRMPAPEPSPPLAQSQRRPSAQATKATQQQQQQKQPISSKTSTVTTRTASSLRMQPKQKQPAKASPFAAPSARLASSTSTVGKRASPRQPSPSTSPPPPPHKQQQTVSGHSRSVALALLGDLARVHMAVAMYESRDALALLGALPLAQKTTGWALCQRGRAFFELADYREAYEAYTQARAVEPHRTEGMEHFSTTLWHLRLEAELTHLAHSLVSVDRRCPQTWCAMGNAFSLRGEHAAATKLFTRVSRVFLKCSPHSLFVETENHCFFYRCTL